MFDAIGIVSKNLENSKKFYKLLGLNFKEISSKHLEATTSSGIRIMLDSYELISKINPRFKSGAGISICFKMKTPKEVDELYNKIIEAGFKGCKAPWDAFWGQRYSIVLDPDNNQIDIFATL